MVIYFFFFFPPSPKCYLAGFFALYLPGLLLEFWTHEAVSVASGRLMEAIQKWGQAMAWISRINTLRDGLLYYSTVLLLFVNMSMCHFTGTTMKMPGILKNWKGLKEEAKRLPCDINFFPVTHFSLVCSFIWSYFYAKFVRSCNGVGYYHLKLCVQGCFLTFDRSISIWAGFLTMF